MYQARYQRSAIALSDVQGEVGSLLEESAFWRKVEPGAKIGLTAGSRGIADIVPILSAVVRFVKEKGCQPWIIPAMGSHGGGTPEGQLKLLAGLGITEEAIGAPLVASGEAVRIGEVGRGVPVYVNRVALEMDGLIVVNRVKPHTSFHAPIESGLLKMLAVGLGNPQGAASLHSYGIRGLESLIPLLAAYTMEHLPVLYGIAIVENAYEQTALLAGLEPEQFYEREQELLKTARSLMPRLPFNDLDLLVVRSMGKCFSGTGMDTNIIGRLRIQGEPEPEHPHIKRIAVLDLDERSKGNALGVGLADFTTDRLLAKVDWTATYLNVLSTTFVMRAMTPMHFATDEEVLSAALQSLGGEEQEDARVLVIDNTLDLSRIEFSAALLEDVRAQPPLAIEGDGRRMQFAGGKLEGRPIMSMKKPCNTGY
jgi:hypothetical protein